MPLTKERREYWEDVLEKTSGSRKQMFAERKVPEDYEAHKEEVIVREEIIEAPKAGIPVKVYVTIPKKRARKKLVYINIHGGGWHEAWEDDDALYCAQIAHEVGCITVDVDYTLSSYCSFPVPVEQVYAVACWVKDNCTKWGADPNYITIGGCSSGGNMTAAVTLLAAVRKDVKFLAQILDNASLDKATDPQCKPCGHEYMMDPQRGRGFTALYLGEELATAYLPIASPGYATDHMLESQPQTLLISGGKCNFRFEDEAYGLRLAQAGVPVMIKRFTESRHAFNIRMKDQWRESHELVIRYLKTVHDCCG